MKASAPGKVILLGEHAVVYGRPALAVPVSEVRAQVDVAESPRPGIWIDAPDVGLHGELNSLPRDQPLAALVHNLLETLQPDSYPDLQVTINSTIPVAAGMGSGAAVSVALIRALSSTLGLPLTDEQVSAYAYDIEKLYHGTPSGIDNTVVTYAKPVFFVKGQAVETLDVGAPLTIVIADSGIPAPTKEAVADVRGMWLSNRVAWESIFDEIGDLARQARVTIEEGVISKLGRLMDQNQALLRRLTVSSPGLDRLCSAAKKAGALGAKLSGGGRGGNMIALVNEGMAQATAAALRSAGSPRVLITTVEASAQPE